MADIVMADIVMAEGADLLETTGVELILVVVRLALVPIQLWPIAMA